MPDELQVTVKRPRGNLGPMSLEALAELVAGGTVSPTDLISDGGPWVRVEDYVAREADRPDDRAAVVDALFEDDFAIELEGPRSPASGGGGGAPASASKSPSSGRPAPAKAPSASAPALSPPAAKPPSPPPASTRPSVPDVDEDDIIELLAADAPDDEEDIIDLELLDEEEPAPRSSPASKSSTAPKAPGAGKKPSIRPMPLPSSPAGMAGGPAPSNEALTPNLPPGFRPLLNGRTLSGWEFFPLEDRTNGRSDAWSIVEGILRFDARLKRPHLLTIPVFGDFEVFFAWRAPDDKARGGLILRGDGADGESAPHIVIGGADAGRLQGTGASGSKASPKLQKPAGEWNVWRVAAQGEQIKLWCNQEPAWSNGRLTRPKGKLGLRAEGTAMEYKFLHVKEAAARAS